MADGFTYIPNPHANDVDQVLSDMTARARQQEMTDQQQKFQGTLADQQQAAASKLAALKQLGDQFSQLNPDQKAKVWGTLPPEAKQYLGLDPTTVPADPVAQAKRQADLSGAQLSDLSNQTNISTVKNHPLNPVEASNVTYHALTNTNAPEKQITDVINRSGMSAPEYHDSLTAPTLETQAKTAHEQAQGKLVGAQAVEVHPNAVAERGLKVGQTAQAYGNANESNAKSREADAKTADAKKFSQMLSGTGAAGTTPTAGPTNSPVAIDRAALAKAPQIVQMLVNRDYNPALLRKTPLDQQEQLFSLAARYDPTVNTGDYDTQWKAKQNFDSGEGLRVRRNINQFLAHVNELKDAHAKLNNASMVPGITNPVANTVAGWVNPSSQQHQSDYQAKADAVANEYENMLRGSSQSTGGERAAVHGKLSMNQSPDSINGAINGMLDVMAGRLGELNNEYQTTTGLRGHTYSVLNPRSEAILRRFGKDPQAIYDNTTAHANTAGKPATPQPAATGTTTSSPTNSKLTPDGHGGFIYQ